ncbi:MAG: hypothetical protein JWO03_3886, partial [Bacteroidetes bacterium]|nr:hypothetical protein [Bacteroidota bacterium]
MKLYKLLFTFLLASCCWIAAFPQCNMQASFTYTHSGLVYTFNASQTGGVQPVQYAWEIDYGMTNLTPNTSYVATLTTGAHRVCVVAMDTTSCYDSTCATIYSNCTLATTVNNLYGPGSIALLAAQPSGAHGHLSYHWSTGATSNMVTVTAAGNYCVTVTDSVGCTATACYNWAPCNVTATYTYNHTPTNVYTFVGTSSGGTGPHHYTWFVNQNSYPNNSTIFTDSLAPGHYQVCFEDSDASGCTGSWCDTFTVHPIGGCALTANITATGTPGSTGILTAHPTGAHGSVSYNWSPAASTSSILTVANAGN